jgi:hypothetical protein
VLGHGGRLRFFMQLIDRFQVVLDRGAGHPKPLPCLV